MDYKKELDLQVDKNFQNIIDKTTELITIKSVYENPSDNMPFGKGNFNALEYMLNLCKTEGFETTNLDSKIAFAQIGKGKKLISALTHLDVVPEGEGWEYDPFSKNIVDGTIIGRGANDNKGPAIASFYALKAIKNSNLPLNARFRLIFGCDEETGFRCLNHYKETQEIPDYSLVPDASFPVTNCEKGILYFDIVKHIKNSSVLEFNCGHRTNMVPANCMIKLVKTPKIETQIREAQKDFKLSKYLTLNIEKDFIQINAFGIQAHASTPENGLSAAFIMFSFLKNLNIDCDFKNFINFFNSKIADEVNGDSAGLGFKDKKSGSLTLNIGLIRFFENQLRASVDIRYPISTNKDTIINNLQTTLKNYYLQIENISDIPPLYVDPNSRLVKDLLSTYNEFMGQNLEPLSIGFSTYAHGIDNAVAFGPKFPNENIVAHNSNEYISIDSLIKITKLYARAMYKLSLE